MITFIVKESSKLVDSISWAIKMLCSVSGGSEYLSRSLVSGAIAAVGIALSALKWILVLVE